MNLEEVSYVNQDSKGGFLQTLQKPFQIHHWLTLHLLLLFTKGSNMQIKNTLGVEKVQGQSEAAV